VVLGVSRFGPTSQRGSIPNGVEYLYSIPIRDGMALFGIPEGLLSQPSLYITLSRSAVINCCYAPSLRSRPPLRRQAPRVRGPPHITNPFGRRANRPNILLFYSLCTQISSNLKKLVCICRNGNAESIDLLYFSIQLDLQKLFRDS
jgi:hypothetical protein